jgi:hypothetical protein
MDRRCSSCLAPLRIWWLRNFGYCSAECREADEAYLRVRLGVKHGA